MTTTAQLIAEAKARLAAKETEKQAAIVAANDAAVAQQSAAAAKDGQDVGGQAESVINKPDVMAAMGKVVLTVPARIANPSGQQPALVYNEQQQRAITLGTGGRSFCLTGAAGTGKTTTTRELITQVQRSNHCLPFPGSSKYLSKGAPGIVICGFTNKAVNNIRKGLPLALQSHCMTIHKLIEFGPVSGFDGDAGTGAGMFIPYRHRMNKLPHISVLIVEESSMVGIDLWAQLFDALPNPSQTQIIMLGDINQIKPVFGPSILGFKLSELPVVELTHVYRQALESPIISLATNVRTNNSFKLPHNLRDVVLDDRGEHGKVTLHPWKQRVAHETAIHFMKKFLPSMIDAGVYDPEEDQILCPFNKSFGTVELNKIIGDHLAKKRGSLVWEVIARSMKSYWAVGDNVLYDRHEARIVSIEHTKGYVGKYPQTESTTLNRWGFDPNGIPQPKLTAMELMDKLEAAEEDGDATNLASHTIKVYIPDLDVTETLSAAGQINALKLRYALTIHKSQGSEWRRVFLFLHASHARMLSRELLYTGITRAKEELYIICEGDTKDRTNSITAAAQRPDIPGTTMAEKIAYFSALSKSMKKGSDDDIEDDM